MTAAEPFTDEPDERDPVTFATTDTNPLPCPECRCVVCRRLRE